MFTRKDIDFRTIFVVNCIQERNLRVSRGELLLEEKNNETGKTKTLTKLPFQKILALFVIGHITVTTPLIDKCQKYGVAVIVMKPNLRPVFYWSNPAEANYLLRQRQYSMNRDDLTIAKNLVSNKISNQIKSLSDTIKRDNVTINAIECCRGLLSMIDLSNDYYHLMGIEGAASRTFFFAFFQEHKWESRRPRTKCDVINSSLDIGYTILFNYIECFLRMFGFDLYVGVYHRLWFRRKSLVCDIIEPFRCIIDKAVRTAFNKKQFTAKDFELKKGEYYLKREKNKAYQKVFFDALVPYKKEVFLYIQSYYRCFMQRKSVKQYPKFLI